MNAKATRRIGPDERFIAIRGDARRIATCLEAVDLSTPIPSCPGWDLRTLGVHVGLVHRWATHAIRSASVPSDDIVPEPSPDASGEELAAWLRLGSGILVDILATTRPDAATWHPFPLEQRAWVWSRRMMQETMVHRWDGEVATGGRPVLDARAAADGIDEFLELRRPGVFARGTSSLPTRSLHLHCTDDDLEPGTGEWTLWNDRGDYRVDADHRSADTALRGSAAAILLVLLGRAHLDTIEVIGDSSAADEWLDPPAAPTAPVEFS